MMLTVITALCQHALARLHLPSGEGGHPWCCSRRLSAGFRRPFRCGVAVRQCVSTNSSSFSAGRSGSRANNASIARSCGPTSVSAPLALPSRSKSERSVPTTGFKAWLAERERDHRLRPPLLGTVYDLEVLLGFILARFRSIRSFNVRFNYIQIKVWPWSSRPVV